MAGLTMPTIAQELPYLWTLSPAEINKLSWIILTIFNDHRFAEFAAYQEAQDELEAWRADTCFRVEAQICSPVAPFLETNYMGEAPRISLPRQTYLRFRSEEDAVHFKLRWL